MSLESQTHANANQNEEHKDTILSNQAQEQLDSLYSDPATNQPLDFFRQNSIVIKPEIIWDLLMTLKTCDDNEKVLILDKIKECLEKFALNCLSIVDQPLQKVSSAHLQSVIELFIENALASFQGNSDKVILNYLVIIPTLFRYVRLEKSHLTKIYSILSESCYEQKLTNNLLFHTFKLLRSLLALEISKLEGSLSFFYFSGLSSKISISTQQQSLWPFSSGFALSIWFYLEDANKLYSLQPEATNSIEKLYPKLLSLHCQGNGGFEIYFRGENLYYRIIGPNYEEDTVEQHRLLIGDFHPKTWYYLGIEHEPQRMIGKAHINIVINNEYKRSINFEYPKISQNATITKFTLGENLIGRISSAILFKQSIGQAKLSEVFTTFKSGIQDNSSIRNLHLSMQKLLDKVMLMYAPIRADGDKCFDIFNSMHGTLDSNSGFTLNDFTKFRFKSLGGLASILPLFYLLRFVDNQNHGDLLNELWKLLIALLKGQPENQIEAVKMGLFKIIGQLLSETSCNFFTFESVELLAELRNCLNNPQLDTEMFVNLLWRADIYNHTDEEVRNQIWGYIRTIYLQNSSHYYSLFKIKDIINLAIDKYDGPFKKKAFENSNKEWNSTKTPEYKQAESILGSIFNVIEAILYTGGDSVLEGIPSTIKALTFKCSPYFHLLALKMLKNVISSKRDPKAAVATSYTKLLLENNIIYSLLYLMTNTSCLDLKASCIKLINKLIHHPLNTTPELDVINYIAEAIWSPLIWSKDNDCDSDVSSSRGSTTKGLSAHLNRAFKSQNQSVFSPEKGNRFSLEAHIKANRKMSGQSQSDFGKEEINAERSPNEPPYLSEKTDSQNEIVQEKLPIILKINPIEVPSYNEVPITDPQIPTNPEFLNPRLNELHTEESQPNSAPLTMAGPLKYEQFIFEPKEYEANYEPLYVSLLEWLLHKPPGTLEGTVMIDDTDRIKSISVIFIIMKYFKYVPESVKQKIIQDIYMLIKWSSKNLLALLEVTEFQYFLLDTLYKYQVSLFDLELKGISMAVWELGIKTYILLMRYILQTNPQGWKHLQNLFVWIENKRLVIANQTSPTKSEKAACYLVQYIWLNLLESFQNDTGLASLPRDSILWISFIQMTFYTKYIVTTAFNPSILSAVNAELEAKNLSPISNFLTKVAPNEPYPLNFEAILKKSSWTDWKVCETLFKILEPLWVESVFSQAGIVGNTSETQKLEKRIHNLMDPSQTEELTKRIGVFFVESPDDNVSGYFLKVLVQLLTCYLEDAAKNGLVDSTMLACKEIENISRFILIALENVKEKSLDSNQQTFLLSTILCLLKFLYGLYGTVKEEEIKKRLLLCLRRIIMHLMCQVAYMNKKTGDFINLADVKEAGLKKESLRGNFTYVIFDLVLNYLTIKNDPIITVQLIKTLKLQDFSSLEDIMLTHEWKLTFTNNEKVNKVINDYYGASLYMVNTEISKRIQDYAYEQTAVVLNQEKAREEMCKRLELEILDIAIEIAEKESQNRQASLASEEETIRTAKNAWRQLWKRFRIYVGQWTHPKFYDQQDYQFSFEDESFDNMQRNYLFSHKISKYESKSRARPFLKVKLLEPAYIADYNKMLKQNRADIHDIINSLDANLFVNKNLTMSEFENRRKRAFSISRVIANSRKSTPSVISVSTQDNTKSEVFQPKTGIANALDPKAAPETAPKEEILLVQKCQWIKTLTIRVGHLQITGHQLKFILEGLDQQESHISFMKHSLPVDKKISKEWPLGWIREIQRRRYIYRKTGIEIYLIDGSSLFFNFPDGGIEEVINLFMKMKRIECYNLISYGSFDPKKIIEKSALTKRWLLHEISNFEYLIQLNALAGRSYKDMTQYPVFPWVLNNFSGTNIDLKDPASYRDLVKTMGAMGNKERIQTFLERFENFDPFNPVPKFHFGSHYSSPAIILQFLIRLAPYTQGAIQLQSGKFDLADRLFHSMEESFKGATEEISDVRELIPEFFCLPDFFVNKEKHDFGKTQSGVRVHHVSTPKWCGKNPYRFVATLRTALESPFVSRALHNWIDLIFGYKQTGKEAEKSLNVYYYMTYEDNVDLDKQTDPVTKMSFEAQIVHFGQTPLQLFTKPHPQRNSLNLPKLLADVIASARVYKSHLKKIEKDAEGNANAPNQMINHGDGIMRLRIMSDARIIGLRRNGKISYFKWWTSTNSDALNETAFKFGVEKEKVVKLNRRKADHFDFIDASMTSISYPYVFLDSGKIVVAGGYWDGRLNLYSTEKDTLFDAYYHHSNTITALAVDSEETILVTGSKSGECLLWNISPELTKLTVKFQFYDHRAKINHIHISEELRLFATASEDGKINLYHSLLGKIFRTLYHPLNLPIRTAFLSFSPLPCIVFFSSENKTLYSYSINGRFIESATDNSEQISSPLLLKDTNFLEMLVYGNDKGDVYVRDLPFLNLKKKFEVTPGAPVLSILPSNDRRYLFCGSGNGEFTFITDPNYIFQNPLKNPDEV